MSTALAAGDAATTTLKDKLSTSQDFPQYPGDDVHAHAAKQYQEAVEARWAKRGLLATANGGYPAAANAIIDIDLNELPPLPVGDRDHNRRKEARIKIKAQNESNAQKRITITLDAWTEIYTDLKMSTEVTAPILSRDLKASCDLAPAGQHIGSFDGPRAWRIALHYLYHGGQRTETEKDFYRTSIDLQSAFREHPLSQTVALRATTARRPLHSSCTFGRTSPSRTMTTTRHCT